MNGALKPDLVDYGGNSVVDSRMGDSLRLGAQGVGELSVSHKFAEGRPFTEDSGTSFATPRVANAAAKVFAEFPNGSVDLCRALLVAHARTPEASKELLKDDEKALLRLTGYGRVDRSALYRSAEDHVTLWAEEVIANRTHHFFETPIPSVFWEDRHRLRELTVALAYRPPVRTTRIDYRASKISFKLVQARSLDEVAKWFNAAEDPEGLERIPERATGRGLSETVRSKGTVQATTWQFTTPSQSLQERGWFVVVTRNDPPWGDGLCIKEEPYALVVVLNDRLGPQLLITSQIYTQIQTRLRARTRARAHR